MNKETAEYVSELIRNTIKYLHQQEVVLLQLASQIEVDHGIERPGQSPTVYPYDETADLYKPDPANPGKTVIETFCEKHGIKLTDSEKTMFVGTPKGENLFTKMFNESTNKEPVYTAEAVQTVGGIAIDLPADLEKKLDEAEKQEAKSKDSDYQYAFPWGRRKKPETDPEPPRGNWE